jgi:hypothetical protein
MHAEIPDPPAPSVQLKFELTTCPSAYVAPATGVEIDAIGEAAML